MCCHGLGTRAGREAEGGAAPQRGCRASRRQGRGRRGGCEGSGSSTWGWCCLDPGEPGGAGGRRASTVDPSGRQRGTRSPDLALGPVTCTGSWSQGTDLSGEGAREGTKAGAGQQCTQGSFKHDESPGSQKVPDPRARETAHGAGRSPPAPRQQPELGRPPPPADDSSSGGAAKGRGEGGTAGGRASGNQEWGHHVTNADRSFKGLMTRKK